MGIVLDDDTLADLEGDASLLRRCAGLDDDALPSPVALVRQATGHPPLLSRALRQEACFARVGDAWRVVVSARALPARRGWLACHEVAEQHLRAQGYQGADIEERADALGAALVLPRLVLRAACRRHGHRVHVLARELRTTQSLVLLRLGEVERRPVALVRRGVVTVRGEPFAWPRRVGAEVPGTHPLRITDEPARVGVMARR
jgi:hypothetical protein